MNMRFRSLLFVLASILLLTPAVLAADLGAGGTIVLTEDTKLTAYVTIDSDTVLDLNGYTISGKGFFVSEGASLLLKNGTVKSSGLNNSGECSVENVEFSRARISNTGHMTVIRNCRIESGSICVYNIDDGEIELIENCDIKSGSGQAVLCGGSGGNAWIGRIRNCRLESEDDVALEDGGGLINSVENCILVGNIAGQRSGGSVMELTECTIVGKDLFAVLQKGPAQSEYRDCVFISEKWSAGIRDGFDLGAGGMLRPEDAIYVEEELVNAENCSHLLEDHVEVTDYTAWEMPALPASAAPGLSNFKTVNAYTAGQFADVTDSYWGAPNIAKAYELGLMKGSSDSAFDPEGSVTVAQTITMAARLHSIYATGSENFVQSGVWYQTYVDYCKANGILKKDFADYNAPAKRSEFAAILAAALPAEALSAINTVSVIPDVAEQGENGAAIYALYRAGILTGNDAQGTFGPETSINRAAAAAILTRMADTSLRKHITL